MAIVTGLRAYAWAPGYQHEHYYYHLPDVDTDLILEHSYPCLGCGEVFHPSGVETYYDSSDGTLKPGMAYWDNTLPEDYYWDNHKGPHLHVVCPNGGTWNIDSRASNCALKDDRLHRCWVRHGDPADGTLHIDKSGPTCAAGGGSIQIGYAPHPSYHGFLHHGHFIPC